MSSNITKFSSCHRKIPSIMTSVERRPALDHLPPDLLWIIVYQGLSLLDLSRLAQTCRLLHDFVEEFGWKAYARAHPEPSLSLTPALESLKWTTGDLLRNQELARKAWRHRSFITRPLGPEWSTKYHPKMAISSSRLVVAAGNTLFLYRFMPPVRKHSEQPRVIFERAVMFPKDAKKDFTGVSFVGSEDHELLLAFASGELARVQLPHSLKAKTRRDKLAVYTPAPTYLREHGPAIRALSTTRTAALTLTSAGVASVYSLTDPSSTSTIDLGITSPVKGWSAHLALQSSSGYAVIGTASPTPLVVHPITESGLLPSPQAVLSSNRSTVSSRPAAVYSICGATPTFPSASTSPQIVISGWYHGAVVLHDLRCATHTTDVGIPILRPAITMRDPVVLSPIYSVSSAGTQITGGSAQHSLIHLYDVRTPLAGWSIYLPQPQRGRSSSSPVYSCLLESTRLWAATESRAFVVDFGCGHNEHTYPTLSDSRDISRSPGDVGWPATFYEHNLFYRPRPNGWRTGVVNTIA